LDPTKTLFHGIRISLVKDIHAHERGLKDLHLETMLIFPEPHHCVATVSVFSNESFYALKRAILEFVKPERAENGENQVSACL
jgi:hypothetical protein